jgi:hypothetical protein
MQDYVWVSNAREDPLLIKRVDTDISIGNVELAIRGERDNSHGIPVGPEVCPKRIWAARDVRLPNRMPDLFWAMCQWIVSERAADILQRFNLGGGALYPVTEGIFQHNQKTRLDGNYFCWTFGNVKSAFVPEGSPNAQPPDNGPWWNLPWKPQDWDIGVNQQACNGPEVWVDLKLFKSLFLSRQLGDALEKARLQKAFRIYKCAVV